MTPILGSIFVHMEPIEDKTPDKNTKRLVSMGPQAPKETKTVEMEVVELSKNIRDFDKKVEKRRAVSPYDYNSVSIKPKNDYILSPNTALLDPTFNLVGKFLGVDTHHNWSKYSDKVQVIVKWAQEQSSIKDSDQLLKWISNKSRQIPSVGQAKIIDQLYLFAKLSKNK